MTKKIRKKRKVSPIRKNFIKRNLARNLIVFLTLIFLLLLFAYFFLSNSNQEIKQSKTNNILQEKKIYSNDNHIKEVLEDKKLDTKNDSILDKEEKEQKTEEKPKEKEEDKKDISKEILEKKQLKTEDKKEVISDERKSQKEIEDEIIEEPTKDKKTVDKNVVTSKDRYKHNPNQKPKLVIIIDDVVTKAQKDKILNIGYPVNMSFLPPNSGHKDSAQLAQNLPFYMIHFPLQASKNFKNSEEETLKVTDSYEKIEARVKQLRAWYPNAIYTNNHTGSVFTENYEAMDKLFHALKKYNFIFVDSKTTPNSVAKELSLKYKFPYIVRDTFLDNDRNFTAIQNQLKEAIRVAKKEGYAIAIGHPYDITIKVLKESKELLKDVEPIFLNNLPYL